MKFCNIQEPNGDDIITADWGRSLVQAIKELRPINTDKAMVGMTSRGMFINPNDRIVPPDYESAETLPFQVRWYWTNENKTAGKWQVYLPHGCAMLKQLGTAYSYYPTNTAATALSSDLPHRTFQWYDIPDPADEDASVTTSGEWAMKAWTVRVMFKPWPAMRVSTDTDESGWTRNAWTRDVAQILTLTRTYNSTTETFHIVKQDFTGAVENEWTGATGAFGIRYDMADPTSPTTTPEVKLTNCYRFIGRAQTLDVEDQTITGYTKVYVVIAHSTTEVNLTITNNPSSARSDDDQTVYLLYDLEDNVVTQDYRASVPAMDFYTGEAESPSGGGQSSGS